MRNILLGASALAIVSATPALAAEWTVRVGGYGEHLVGYGTSDVDNGSGEDFDGVDVKQDSEIFFLPSITLDNGIKIGANIQLEGASGDDQIDESFLFIKGNFGEGLFGSENSAGYKMHYDAPSVLFLNPRDLDEFILFSGDAGVDVGDDSTRGTFGQTAIENDRNNDAQRFTYFTPRYAGFQLGASYARDGLQDTNAQVDTDASSLHDIFDIGANYVNSFGDFDVAVSGRWGIASNSTNSDDPEVWGAGLNLGYGGVSIGGSFAEQNDSGTEDGIGYDAGVSYMTGPWGFSFTYHHGENVDDEKPFPGADEEVDLFLLGSSYKLAKGVNINAFVGYVDFEENMGDADGPGDDVTGFAIGSGIKINF